MLKMNIKKNDTVLVIAGKDKGKTGKVVTAIPKSNKITVDGINIQKKHKKPRSANSVGGIISQIGAFDASNVMVICDKCNKATRVAHKIDGDTKIRVCKKCGASLDKAIIKETAEDKKKKKTVDTQKKVEAKKTVKKVDAETTEVKKTVKKADVETTEVKKTVKKADADTAEAKKTVKKAPAKTVKTETAEVKADTVETVEVKAETKKPAAKKAKAEVEGSEPAKKKTAKSPKAE
jgi:large subunit ribosomal protein L24